MRKIGVIPNSEKDPGFAFTRRTAEWLAEQGCAPLVTELVGQEIGRPEYIADINAIYGESEFLVVLGGDGTILRVARGAALHETPLLGVNLGTLGYLTDVDAAQAFEALARALAGAYTVEKRMMLETHILTEGAGGEAHIALNEAYVSRGVFSRMITLRLTVNDEYIDDFRADGIIVATPTGSTAYNLSAGGSILKPNSEMLAITPVCPHMLYARQLVVPAGDVVRITMTAAGNAEGVITLDGQHRIPLMPENTVTIRRSNYYTSIIKTNENSFFDILRLKLMGKTDIER